MVEQYAASENIKLCYYSFIFDVVGIFLLFRTLILLIIEKVLDI